MRGGAASSASLPFPALRGLESAGRVGHTNMSNGTQDRSLEALRRLLADAREGGQVKVDAILALVQRTVWIGTWGPGQEGFRTLMNSEGQTALPIFTNEQELQEAGLRYGWQSPDGRTSGREVGAREALRHAIAHNLVYVIVDIGSEHSLEIEKPEIEPLMSPQARRDSTVGPYAGHGRISSTMMKAVKATPPPGSIPAPGSTPPPAPPSAATYPDGVAAAPASRATPAYGGDAPRTTPAYGGDAPRTTLTYGEDAPRTTPASGGDAPRIATTTADPTQLRPDATFGSGSSVSIQPLGAEPTDELLNALSEVLRGYPEVEWACLGLVSRGPASAVPTVGLRVDTSFRQRVNEIIQNVRQAADARGASLDVLLLDDPQVMRTARQVALVFYPWRR